LIFSCVCTPKNDQRKKVGFWPFGSFFEKISFFENSIFSCVSTLKVKNADFEVVSTLRRKDQNLI